MKYYILLICQLIFTIFVWWLSGYNFDERSPEVVLNMFLSLFLNGCFFLVFGSILHSSEKEKIVNTEKTNNQSNTKIKI